MTIKRHIFDVEYLDDPAATPREFRVRVTMGDKARTETHGPQYGVLDPKNQPQTVGLLWLWFAGRREGHVPDETTFDEFLDRCLDNALVSDEAVDPTRPGASGEQLSTSPDTFPASPTPSGLPPTNV